MSIETLLLVTIMALAQPVPGPADEDYPFEVCWVVREDTSLVSRDGKRHALEHGQMLHVSSIEEKRLFVARARLHKIAFEGWVDRDDVADCLETIRLLDPRYSHKPLAVFSGHLGLAQAYHTERLVRARFSVGPVGAEEQRHLTAAEKLAPDNLEVMWEKALLSGEQPAAERLRLVERVMARAPDNAMVVFFRARAKYDSDDREGAIADFRRSLDLFAKGQERYVQAEHAVEISREYLARLREEK